MEKNLSNLYFTLAVSLFLVTLAAVLVRHAGRARRAAKADWEQLIGRLEWVDRNTIASIAQNAFADDGHQDAESPIELDGSTISSMLGGLAGLEILERNCAVLVDLAAYLQRWYPEALVIAEQLRLNARELEWHVARLKGAAQTGNLPTAFGDYAQRAVVIYYTMTRHVLELYTRTSSPGLNELEASL